jgi:DNA-binding GntR family transcriptional regulator
MGLGLDRADLISQTSTQLRELITSGRLAPGAPLIEREVARRLRVSRGTARAALRSLQHEGYVRSTSVEKYSRFSVAPLTVDDLTDLSTIMAALDSAAARLVAELEPTHRARLVRDLKDANTRLEAAVTRATDPDQTHELDRLFHQLYVGAAGGPRLQEQWTATHAQLSRYTRLYSSALSDRSAIEHRAIITAIRSGDSAAAQRAAEANWLNSISRAEAGIRRAGERGVW